MKKLFSLMFIVYVLSHSFAANAQMNLCMMTGPDMVPDSDPCKKEVLASICRTADKLRKSGSRANNTQALDFYSLVRICVKDDSAFAPFRKYCKNLPPRTQLHASGKTGSSLDADNRTPREITLDSSIEEDLGMEF